MAEAEDPRSTSADPAFVSLTFNDGLRCRFEHAVPVLNQHGLLATFFLTANTEPIHIDWCEHPAWRKIEWNEDDIRYLQGLKRRGHEIGSHSVWHKITNPNDSRYR